MLEGHGRVVGEALLDEDVPVEPPHLQDTDDADAAERLGIDVEDLAFGHVGSKDRVGRRLEPEDRHFPGPDPALERPPGHVRVLPGLHQPVHDELVAHRRVEHARRRRVAAVEAHE